MKFIESEAALLLNSHVIVSDLHIGFEEEFEKKGYVLPDQTINTLDRLKELSKLSKKLVILGDVKHSLFLRKKYALRLFLSKLSEMFKKIIIVKGNHDGKIETFTIEFNNINVVNEFLIGKTLCLHGHKNASKEAIIKAKQILIGHFHSSIKIKTHLGKFEYKKVWAIYEFNNNEFLKQKKIKTNIKEVISFPCFNKFFDGGGEKIGPYAKYLIEKEIITTDLTRLV